MADMPAGAPSGHDVFLTPRVIDRNAFEEFSLNLRTLIQQASGEGASLRHALIEFKSFDQSARAVTGELQRRMEAVARAIPALDERLSTLDRMMRSAIDPSAAAQQAEREVESAISRRLEAALERTQATVQAIEERFARMERDRLELLARLEAQKAERLEQAALNAERTAEACERRAAEAAQSLQAFGTDASQAAEARLTELTRRAETLVERLETTLANVQSAADAPGLEDRMSRLGAVIEQRVTQIKSDLAAATGPAVSNLSLLCHRAVDIIGRDPRIAPDQAGAPPHRPGSLGDLVSRAERSADAANMALHQAEAMRQQVEQAHSALRDAVLHGAEWADGLNARVDRARRNAADAERICDRIERSLAANGPALQAFAAFAEGDRLDALAARAAELQAASNRLMQLDHAARETLAAGAESWYRAESLGARIRELQSALDLAEERARGLSSNSLNRLRELEGSLSGASDSLADRAQQIEQRLDQAIRQAALAAAGTAEQATLAREAEERLRAVADALESWRDVLTDQAGPLPAPLTDIVADFKSRLEHQLGRAATLALEFERRLAQDESQPSRTAEANGIKEPKPAQRARTPKPRKNMEKPGR